MGGVSWWLSDDSSVCECRNSHFTNNKLKVVCGVLDLEKKGTHSDLVDRILTFLVAPKNSGKVSSERPPAQTHRLVPGNHMFDVLVFLTSRPS